MAKRERKGNSVQGRDLFSSSASYPPVGCTDPAKEAKKAAKNEAEKLKLEALKESRIEQISALMRLMYTKVGGFTWDRKMAQGFALAWNIPLEKVYVLSGIASKRVHGEVHEYDGVARDASIAWAIAIRQAMAAGNLRDVARLIDTGTKLAGLGKPVEVEVKIKEPTPADAQAAVKKNFQKDIKKEEPE